jgi:hypothetical protein
MVADWGHKWNPFPNDPDPFYNPTTTQPLIWPQEKVEEFEDLLKRVKELEDKLGGCPCEDPKKVDFLEDIKKGYGES